MTLFNSGSDAGVDILERKKSVGSGGSSSREAHPGKVEGTDLTVNLYPHPSLRAPNLAVTAAEIESGEAEEMVNTLLAIMYAAEGCGLAAPQVGMNKRVLVFNPTGNRVNRGSEQVYLNPEITDKSRSTEVEHEGCLSFPNMTGRVVRPRWVAFKATDLSGRTVRRKLNGWAARVFLHEFDHLEGVLYVDRVLEEDREEVGLGLRALREEWGLVGEGKDGLEGVE